MYNIKGTEKLPLWQDILFIILAILLLPVTIILAVPYVKLKKYCKAKNYTVTKLPSDYKPKTNLIAHRGFRAVAPENTLPAFEAAGKADYWGAENDIHRTKDGVWVVHHDSHTIRMLSKDVVIEKSNYADLLKLNVLNGSNFRDYPNLKVPTLESFLQVCAKYNMKAFVELKGKLNTEYYGEIVDLVKKYNVETSFISFEKEAVLAMRKITDAPLYYIVYTVKPKDIEFAKSVANCGIDFDGNDDKNKSKQTVDMIKSAGLEPAIWAVDDLDLVKNYADWGVKYITTNQVCY